MISGVYRIYNITTGDSYVGQSLDVSRRLKEHYKTLNSLTHQHHSAKLQADWDKYGEDNFKAEVIELCPESKLEEREKYWIQFYEADSDTGYNVRVVYNKPIKDEIDKAISLLTSLKERI